MQTDRDRLIELFSPFADGTYNGSGTIIDGTKVDDVVDHLLANGVIVPPVQIGQKVWILYSIEKTIRCKEITSITRRQKSWTIHFTCSDCFTVWDNDEDEYFGKTVFLTKEEAEQKLKELNNGTL